MARLGRPASLARACRPRAGNLSRATRPLRSEQATASAPGVRLVLAWPSSNGDFYRSPEPGFGFHGRCFPARSAMPRDELIEHELLRNAVVAEITVTTPR